MTLVFIDTETTSLRHDRRAWDIALIVRTEDGDAERQWFIDADDLDLGNADLKSLQIGRFHERHPDASAQYGKRISADGRSAVAVQMRGMPERDVLLAVERLTRGAHLVGAVPNFDAEVLAERMRFHGICPSWHYHLVDVETLAAGILRQPPPWNFDGLLDTFGLRYAEVDRHTALGDARMVRNFYDTMMAAQ